MEVGFEDAVVGELNDRARHFVSNLPLQTVMLGLRHPRWVVALVDNVVALGWGSRC